MLLLALPVRAAESKITNPKSPTLTITNLVAAQRFTNADFTVGGTATGKSGVSRVRFSLNQHAWTNASTINGWTNWSVPLILTPGTNTFSAYAVGNTGGNSKTNTINFIYVMLTTLTVRTNGEGNISPNYDGVPLQVGNTYSMTATSSIAGFGLQTWTDGSNKPLTNSATLNFVMASNLTFVANMGDIIKPVIAITSVVTNTGGVPTSLIITGTASDNIAVTNVQFNLQYPLNQGVFTNAFTSAASGDNWSNWTAAVTLQPGTNLVTIQAVDSGGNVATTNTSQIFYMVSSILTVRTNGFGKVSPAYDGASLNIGQGYSIKATGTKSGIGLICWTDGSSNVLGTTATLKFLMASNLTLVANLGDVTPPTVNVGSTTTNSDGIPNDFVVHGVANDNVAVTNVYYNLNGGVWTNATTTNSWTNWTANISLLPGANTFSVYSVDSSSNISTTLTAQINYSSAPASLAGQSGYMLFINNFNPLNLDPLNFAPLDLAFGKTTFSQFSQDTNNVNGIGSYTYTQSGVGGNLKINFTGPPSIANVGSQSLGLSFFTPGYAYFTNKTTTYQGYIIFSSVSNLTPASVTGELLWLLGTNGQANGLSFSKKNFTEQDLTSSRTNSGSFKYTDASPVCSLFTLTYATNTTYVLAYFADTNFATYASETYDKAKNTNGTDKGRLLVSHQESGGNAPYGLTNSILQYETLDEYVNLEFATNTFSQDTLSTNYDNDVGTFTYDRADTNVATIGLTVTVPPNLAGSNDSAQFVFVNNSYGLFTNNDGTVSLFTTMAATNLTPNSITNQYVTLSYDGGGTDYFAFTDNGVLYYWFIFQYFPVGTYTYNVFSPGGAMVYLDINSFYSFLSPQRDWLQLNFNASGAGAFYKSVFDTNTNFLGSVKGNFILLNLQ